MHGGLYVEMASFFVSRIAAGINDVALAVKAPGLSAAIPSSLVVIKRISNDGFDGRNSYMQL
jgi:hypothetical protein